MYSGMECIPILVVRCMYLIMHKLAGCSHLCIVLYICIFYACHYKCDPQFSRQISLLTSCGNQPGMHASVNTRDTYTTYIPTMCKQVNLLS